VKLVITVVSTIVLVIKLKLIGYAAEAAAQTSFSGADLRQAGIELVAHGGGGWCFCSCHWRSPCISRGA